MQEYFSFLWKLGGGFKDAAVTTTYVDNITGLRWSCSGTAGPAQLDQLLHQQNTSDYISLQWYCKSCCSTIY
jgi:hypothetical protein